jgi:hypothetical protein
VCPFAFALLSSRPQEGLFGLRVWIDEGFFPNGWAGPSGTGVMAPFKKRNAPAKVSLLYCCVYLAAADRYPLVLICVLVYLFPLFVT